MMRPAHHWFDRREWTPHGFQLEAWDAFHQGRSGIVNAPTGSGKTYALALPLLLECTADVDKRLQAIWVIPIRALAKEIHQALTLATDGMDLGLDIAIRTGDTSSAERQRMKKRPPHVLITTPESIHILLASKGAARSFRNLHTVVVDEWHEFVGSKRGVQVQLALSRFKGIRPDLRVWGISATIGNMDEALHVLHGADHADAVWVRAHIEKRIDLVTVLPDRIETLPWAGHLGIHLLEKVLPLIRDSQSTLIFTNTRSQCEIWYQRILDVAPELAGLIAMHHGSIDKKLRHWVEDALYDGTLKAVVCTSSLDLGVDFRPVETIIQIGSPKGIARFMQRAGRSNHRPGETSRIHFVPTHALEILEGAALRQGLEEQTIEARLPYVRSFDVLIQYLCTLAVADGFHPDEVVGEIRSTFAFESVDDDEWRWVLDFITRGGDSLQAYDDFHKVVVDDDGLYRITDRRIARRHRLSIGTIVSDAAMTVKYTTGRRIGTIEEWFVTQLRPGDVFWFAGRSQKLVRIKENTVQVKRSRKRQGKVPSWQGGRMPLSSQLSAVLREQYQAAHTGSPYPEVAALEPLFELQAERSVIPRRDEFLVEGFQSRFGHHLVFYPFEGRLVHEGMASLVAHRLSRGRSIAFTITMNDYSFQLLSDTPLDPDEVITADLFTTSDLVTDITASLNAAELARRRFRDIATIGGLVFTGYPGKTKKDRHLQASAQTFFDVFRDHDANNLLYRQAFQETMEFQLEEQRLRDALDRIRGQRFVVTRPPTPTPFAFPVIVDRLNAEKLSTESVEDRIRRMVEAWR